MHSARRQCPDRLRRASFEELAYVPLAPGEHLNKFVSLPIARDWPS
jgi:hypothetical protein